MEGTELRSNGQQFQAQLEALRTAATECEQSTTRLDNLLHVFDVDELQKLEVGKRILRLHTAPLRDFLELLKLWDLEFKRIDQQLVAASKT
ncbi:hypothetical protein HY009_04695 [Candidatus Acetothermia bacterium]|nr:hypothetical protein [Candidatus Acetothermia bacterium]